MRVIQILVFMAMGLSGHALFACNIEYDLTPEEAARPVFVLVDKSSSVQKMCVFNRGTLQNEYSVSTGRENIEGYDFAQRRDYITPYCSTTPTSMSLSIGEMNPERTSQQWTRPGGSAPIMYNALELQGTDNVGLPVTGRGIFIHGVEEHHEERIGRRASGACIRMMRSDSDALFQLIQTEGRNQTTVRIINSDANAERQRTRDCLLRAEVYQCIFQKLRAEGRDDAYYFRFTEEEWANRYQGDKYSNEAYQFAMGELQAHYYRECENDRRVLRDQARINEAYDNAPPEQSIHPRPRPIVSATHRPYSELER